MTYRLHPTVRANVRRCQEAGLFDSEVLAEALRERSGDPEFFISEDRVERLLQGETLDRALATFLIDSGVLDAFTAGGPWLEEAR